MIPKMLAKIGFQKILLLVLFISFNVHFPMNPTMVNVRNLNVRIGGISALTSY